MKGLDCERENETHHKQDFEGWICCTSGVGAVPPLSQCTAVRLITGGVRSVFEKSVALLSAHEMNSIKMRMDLVAGGATKDAEPRLGP